MKNTTRKNKKTHISSKIVKYIPVDFSYLLGKVNGINDNLMKIHFKLYEGLVGATNASLEKIENTYKTGVKDIVSYNGIQKEFSFFFNGMRLHEMYFGVMCGEDMDKMDEGLKNAIINSFGSFALWKKNFMETGTIPGVGFVALCRDKKLGNLMNIWINEFNIGELIDVDLLLVMDMWEHAFLCEFGLDLKKYHETFLNNVNWSVVSQYYSKSLGV